MNKKTIQNLKDDLSSLMNHYSQDTFTNTPDYVLAEYLHSCLVAFQVAQKTNLIHAKLKIPL